METIDRLVLALTSPSCTSSNNIPYEIYNIKKNILTEKLNHILSILRTNHQDQLSNFVSGLPMTVNPIRTLTKFRKISYDRVHDLLFRYLIELSVLLDTLQSIEENVESIVNYGELEY